ncbi:uncharacterized protein LOC34621506 [Cyclospora cayetanensis]|uniref:Uncharacterized protein LOC34621506 n=1 Tax=Cyclospora cayetanensis TaxID=88456 RepID=A0A6P6S285_9EIME|nr:uncharacterized protein LOC34621506 [Cyclospora cayetanensis]
MDPAGMATPVSVQPPRAAAAAAAVRRLGSPSPLYAVSLSVALSRLLRVKLAGRTDADGEEGGCEVPIEHPSSKSEDVAPPEGAFRGSAASQTSSAAHSVGGDLADTVKEAQARSKPLLTGHFVVQVRAHFERALLACDADATEGEEADTADTANARELPEEEEQLRYREALTEAALLWSLVLLLAAEPALLAARAEASSEQGSSPALHALACSSPPHFRGGGVKTASSTEAAIDGSSRADVDVDTVMREALAALEMILRVSPPAAARMLPAVLEWLDAALDFGDRRESPPLQEAHHGRDNSEVRCLSGEAPSWEASTVLPKGPPLEDAFASLGASKPPSTRFCCVLGESLSLPPPLGPLRRRMQHLQRVRLLSLLLRFPRVLRASARLLAVCAEHTPTVEKGASEQAPASPSLRGTTPEVEGEGGEIPKAATELQANAQRRICSHQAKALCAALRDLAEVLFPGAEKVGALAASHTRYDACNGCSKATEELLVAALLPPQIRWSPGREVASPASESLTKIADSSRSNKILTAAYTWTAAAKSGAGAPEDAPRKAALHLLASIKGLLLSFALRIEGSPRCRETFGAAAAAADMSVVNQAQALLKQMSEFFNLATDWPSTVPLLEVTPVLYVHAVTGLCSRALTAKHLPKAYQVNSALADSRCLLSAGAASAVAQIQLEERGGVRADHRCPLTGRLQLPQGLPDEQLVERLPQLPGDRPHASYPPAEKGFLAYLSDEGAFRMAIQVARMLIALLEDDERMFGLIVPPLLRILDIPQAEVRFLGWQCLNAFISNCRSGGLTNFRLPILQVLMDGFPIFTELDICFDVYLEAFTTVVCRTSVGECDHAFLNCQDFLIDMCHAILHNGDNVRSVFLRRTRPLVTFAGHLINLRLYDWMDVCLEALESLSVSVVIEGLLTLEQLLALGIDMDEFMPQILCRLATSAQVADAEFTSQGIYRILWLLSRVLMPDVRLNAVLALSTSGWICPVQGVEESCSLSHTSNGTLSGQSTPLDA